MFTDGRAYILHSGKQFDVIEADALRPNSAYSGNLYSWEYFQMLKTHLKPGGFAVTWAPTDRVLASFLEVFSFADGGGERHGGGGEPTWGRPEESIMAPPPTPQKKKNYGGGGGGLGLGEQPPNIVKVFWR